MTTRLSKLPSVPDKLITSAEVAERLGVPEPTLRTWRHRGQGPEAVKIGIAVMYDPDVVDEWQRARAKAKTA
jgi:predicted DNA-binding transcriptional regulator AlpA